MMEPEFLLRVTESELYSLRTQIRMKEVFYRKKVSSAELGSVEHQ